MSIKESGIHRKGLKTRPKEKAMLEHRLHKVGGCEDFAIHYDRANKNNLQER